LEEAGNIFLGYYYEITHLADFVNTEVFEAAAG
jgi:hypothetical protein